MATKLKRLKMTKVALVPAGANPDAHIVLYKSADEIPLEKEALTGEVEIKVEIGDEYEVNTGSMDETLPLTTAQRLEQQQLWQQWHPLWDAFTSSIWELMDGCRDGDASTHAPLVLQSITEFQNQATEILTGLGLITKAAPLFAVFAALEKAGRVMSAQRMTQLKTAISTLQKILEEAGGLMEKGTTMADGNSDALALTKRAETAEARVKELEGENAILKKATEPEPTEEEYLKSLPEALRKRWEENERQTKEALETARVEKDKRERREYIEKAAAYRQVGMVADDDWETLQAIDQMPVKPRARVLQLLKSANEALRQSSLWTEAGVRSPAMGGTAWANAEALAVELVTKGLAKTKEQAIVQVFHDHPELRQQYDAEKRGA